MIPAAFLHPLFSTQARPSQRTPNKSVVRSNLYSGRNGKPIPPIFFVLGGPGSGKGTQCNLLKRDYEVQQVCVGDLLRREATRGTTLGNTIEDIMQKGEIVPGHVTMALLKEELAHLAGMCKGVLIDGFPRAMDQAKDFEKMIVGCEFVLYFHCERKVMIERLMKRGKTSGRADDVEEVVTRRLSTFEKKTLPVIEHFRQRGLLCEIEASRGTPEQIYEETRTLFREAIS